MLHWLPFPFLRFALAWVAGLWLAMSWDLPTVWLWACWIFVVIFFLGLVLKLTKRAFHKYKSLVGASALAAIFLAGMVRVDWSPNPMELQIGQAALYWAEVVAPVRHYPKYYQLTVAIQLVKDTSDTFITDNRALWFQDHNTKKPLHYGDRILIQGAPTQVAAPANPYQFDYRQFLQRKGIYWQHWLYDDQILLQHSSLDKGFKQWVSLRRSYLQRRIEQYLGSPASREIAGAMLLGNRQDVSDPVEAVFAKSGTLHILAVSGLHLGIIYGFLVSLLGAWRHQPYWKWVFLLVVLLSLWAFALLTGLAPATRRAAIMFSVMLIGKNWQRKGNNYNALALSACIILLLDPYEWYAVGFQLSFLALGGILYLQPKIASWWSPQATMVKYFWDIISVSLAAQIAVLPISFYYFHQMPVYFLLGNMLMMPLTLVILLVGSLFLLVGFSYSLSVVLGNLLTLLTEFAHAINLSIAQAPGSTISQIWISEWQVVCCYLGLFLGINYFITFQKILLQSFLALWILWLVTTGLKKMQHRDDELVVVYQIKGHTALDFVQGHQYVPYTSPQITEKTISYNITPYRGHQGWQPDSQVLTNWSTDSFTVWMFHGKLVILVSSPLKLYQGPVIKANMVVLSNNAVKDFDILSQRFDADFVVADGSNSFKTVQTLSMQAHLLAGTFYSTALQGAGIFNSKHQVIP